MGGQTGASFCPREPRVLGRRPSRFHYHVEVPMSLSHKLGLVVLLTSPIAACGEPSGPLQDQPAFAPAGNDNKFAFPIHDEFSDVCPGGTEVDIVIDGWIQGRFFPQAKNRNVQQLSITASGPSPTVAVVRLLSFLRSGRITFTSKTGSFL